MRRNTSVMGGGILALAAIGMFVLFRNRDRVRNVLERRGIRVPHRDELVERIRTGASRVINQVKEKSDETLKRVS